MDTEISINVRQFIQDNYTPYYGDESFLVGASVRTKKLNEKYESLKLEELKKGVLDIDTETVAGVDSYNPGYLDKDNEIIVGLQTDSPLKRTVNPYGGMRMVEQSCEAYGYKVSDKIKEIFKYRTTHNDAVFKAYSKTIKTLRHYHLLTGLADSYGRGRILGDYRRVALYGTTLLIEQKKQDFDKLSNDHDFARQDIDEYVRLKEDVANQISALKALERLGDSYGINLRKPSTNAKEAVQAVYMAYLAAVKEQNGAAMSLGRVSTFLDIYIERDIKDGNLTEEQAQELIDDFVLHLRMTRQLRTPEYNELFAGDPTWITESIGGIGLDGRPLVTKTSFRMLNTLYTLGHSPEPNLTILWSKDLPENFKRFCAKVSIDTDSIQYENDDLMRPIYGDDYGIACCVSAQEIGKDMQFFGARCNLPKVLLLAINNGKEEIEGKQIAEPFDDNDVLDEGGYLSWDKIHPRFIKYMEWMFDHYIDAQNIIHTMHDKYDYEALQMSLIDTKLKNRYMAFGIAGFSTLVDSIAAIQFAKVKPIKDENLGIYTDYIVEGDYVAYGNDNQKTDDIGLGIIRYIDKNIFNSEKYKGTYYRNAVPTLSLLTITSNVMYGTNTGATPDGRAKGEPFAPGANPYHNRDKNGAICSLNSVAKIPYMRCKDGISNTFSITPNALGNTQTDRINNLVNLLNGYFLYNGHHLNVNVLNREKLIDAQQHPDKYPTLTIRVSGYAVRFNSLTKKQQDEVIARTFHIGL